MKTCALIDFSHALRVNYHVRSPDSTPTHAGEQTLAQLSDWKRSVDHAIICLDYPPYWRKQVTPTYKASRERDDGYNMLCKWVKDRLMADGYSIATYQSFEADDVIATLADKLKSRFQRVLLVGGDKDMAQCVTDANGHAVHIMCPLGQGKFEERDEEWVLKKYGVGPENMALWQALTGDNSDDIPGIDGVGPKGATKLITTYGTVEKMRMAAVAEWEASQKEGAKPLPAFWKKFLAGSPNLPEYLKLTTLRTDVPLDIDSLLVKRQPAPLVVDTMGEELSDSWEGPSREELEEERAMLDPATIISAPEAKTELPKEVVPSQEALTFGTVASAAHATQNQGAPTAVVSKPPVASSPTPLPSTATSGPTSQTPSMKPPRAAEEITSIVVDRPPAPSWALQLQPASAKEALQIAAVLFNSRVCTQFGSEKGVYAVISLGRELGLGMMQALQGFHIVKDRPFPSAPLLQALAEGDVNCEWLVCSESTDESATWKTKHRQAGEMSFTYDRAEAQKAGCYTGGNKHNWLARERQMMRKTCMANAVRIWYPRAVAGLHLSEEMNDE